MVASTLSNPAQATGWEDVPVAWTDDLTKCEAEMLLDWLEEAGLPSTEIRCTRQGFFGVRLPAPLRRFCGNGWVVGRRPN
jgi:hypothetical protein